MLLSHVNQFRFGNCSRKSCITHQVRDDCTGEMSFKFRTVSINGHSVVLSSRMKAACPVDWANWPALMSVSGTISKHWSMWQFTQKLWIQKQCYVRF